MIYRDMKFLLSPIPSLATCLQPHGTVSTVVFNLVSVHSKMWVGLTAVQECFADQPNQSDMLLHIYDSHISMITSFSHDGHVQLS